MQTFAKKADPPERTVSSTPAPSGAALTPAPSRRILQLQRTLGNQAVLRMLRARAAQAKAESTAVESLGSADRLGEAAASGEQRAAGMSDRVGNVSAGSGILVQRAPVDPPNPGELILGGKPSTTATVDLYHYGDLEGRETFTSTPGFPRLTDYDGADSQADAAKYTGAPISPRLRFRYQLKVDSEYFDENFLNTGTRKG